MIMKSTASMNRLRTRRRHGGQLVMMILLLEGILLDSWIFHRNLSVTAFPVALHGDPRRILSSCRQRSLCSRLYQKKRGKNNSQQQNHSTGKEDGTATSSTQNARNPVVRGATTTKSNKNSGDDTRSHTNQNSSSSDPNIYQQKQQKDLESLRSQVEQVITEQPGQPPTAITSSDFDDKIKLQIDQVINTEHKEKQPFTALTQAEFDKLLAYCVAHDNWDDVLKLLNVMKQQGLSQVRSTYSACLQACQEFSNGDSSLEILTAMQQAGFLPTKDDYALTIATLFSANEGKIPQVDTADNKKRSRELWKDALTIVQEHADLPIESYDLVVGSLTRARKWKESTRLLRTMEDSSSSTSSSNTPPGLSTYSAVLECCLAANQSEQAMQVLQASIRRGLVPSFSSFEQVILALSNKLQWRRALQVVQLMDDLNVPMTLNLYNALLTSCAKAREVGQAKRLLAQMRRKHGITPNIRSYNAVMAACANARNWKDALTVLDQCHLEPGVEPDIYTYTNAIRACAKGGMTRRALTLLQVVKDKGLTPDTYCYTAAIEACAKAGMWKRALELLDEMEANGVEASEVTYSVAISACGNGGEWQKALQLLELMRQGNMRINLISYNAAITALSKAAKQSTKDKTSNGEELWTKAMDILKQMKADGIDPDGFCLCSAISCCGAEGRWQEALELMDVMQKGGPNTRPNKIAYTAAIASCGRSGQVDHAIRLFRQMKEQGLSADRVAYNALFAAFRVAKRADAAVELWEEMLGTKQSIMPRIATVRADTTTTPDIITVTDAIGAISSQTSKESIERIDKLFSQAVNWGIVLRSDTLHASHEVDLTKMSLPVARAACRFILNRIKNLDHKEVRDLTFITGVGVGKGGRSHSGDEPVADDGGSSKDTKGLTSLREYVQEILLTDFNPPLPSVVPMLAQGTVVIERQTLLDWL